MSTYRDNLGGFVIPPHLIKVTESYVPPVVNESPAIKSTTDEFSDWTVVKYIDGSIAGVKHKIEQLGDELRCSCQSFKFGKKGYCKHTIMVKKELDDLPF